jgi:hypothetical protein
MPIDDPNTWRTGATAVKAARPFFRHLVAAAQEKQRIATWKSSDFKRI